VEVERQKQELDVGMAEAEPREKGTVGLRTGSADDERGLGGLDEGSGVAEVFCGEDIVTRAFQQGAEVSEEIGGIFHAQNFWLGRMR